VSFFVVIRENNADLYTETDPTNSYMLHLTLRLTQTTLLLRLVKLENTVPNSYDVVRVTNNDSRSGNRSNV